MEMGSIPASSVGSVSFVDTASPVGVVSAADITSTEIRNLPEIVVAGVS